MALLHMDVWERSHGNVLKVIGGQIVSQRFRVVLEGFDRFYCEMGKKE